MLSFKLWFIIVIILIFFWLVLNPKAKNEWNKTKYFQITTSESSDAHQFCQPDSNKFISFRDVDDNGHGFLHKLTDYLHGGYLAISVKRIMVDFSPKLGASAYSQKIARPSMTFGQVLDLSKFMVRNKKVSNNCLSTRRWLRCC